MSDRSRLDRFLTPEPIDAGCGETLRLLDVYVDLSVAGQDPAARFPGLAAHLRACPACRQDLRGLLAAVAAHGDR